MAATGRRDACRLGFLTTIEVAEHGYIGGLLVTDQRGRPLEFQCTTPVKPNDTQRILYGPTLRPFLYGELIGRTLVEKVGVKPHIVLTEQSDVLPLREHVAMPVALVCGEQSESSGEHVRLGRQTLRFDAAHAGDSQAVRDFADLVPDTADLSEPFERVRDALREALQAGVAR